ncbi:glycoside hydrolase superfamily [Kalaharituber pfeilii]|nr:glycoside hydrolase superfamily [Kalaharituber pfeilii]
MNWKTNIGPLEDRPGRPGGHVDLYSSGTYQLEYAIGDPETTYWGKKRAEHGHPKPFSIKYVEFGNEDWFTDSYYSRFPMFLEALLTKCPDIIYIASRAIENSPYACTPQFFKVNFNYFDNWNEATGYKVITIFNGVGRFSYPPMIAAVGEAIFALAVERNPNVVKLCSYVPLLQNFSRYQWTPDLITFTADPAETLFAMAGKKKDKERVFVKLVNSGAEKVPVIDLDREVYKANVTFLMYEDEYAFNCINNATAISLQERDVGTYKKGTKKVKWDVPGWSVVVLELR